MVKLTHMPEWGQALHRLSSVMPLTTSCPSGSTVLATVTSLAHPHQPAAAVADGCSLYPGLASPCPIGLLTHNIDSEVA